jgi:mRNA interferase RelE/StbE
MPGSDAYSIRYASSVIDEDIPSLSKSARTLIQKAVESRLAHEPIHYGKPLRYSLSGHRRIRVSNYRIIYRVDEAAKTVYVVAIKHRKEAYD